MKLPSDTIPHFNIAAHILPRISLKRPDISHKATLAWLTVDEYPLLRQYHNTFLHENEQKMFHSCTFERRKMSYFLGRCAAKLALSVQLDEPNYNRIEITSGVFNHPVVRYPVETLPDVSISHGERFAMALAFPREHPMGIDLEAINPERINVIKNHMLPSEIERAARNLNQEATMCTLYWTAKEALSKSLRCGLSCPFQILEVIDVEEDGTISPGYTGYFKNFGQYRFTSRILGDTVLTLVYPKKSRAELDLSSLMTHINPL